MQDSSSQANYESLPKNDRKKFFSMFNDQLIYNAVHNPEIHLQEFYDSVWEMFKEEKKSSRKAPKKQKIIESTPEIEDTYDDSDPFHVFVKTQIKLRKDEFKGKSSIDRNKILAHEWNKLTEAEKQQVIKSNGHFSK